MKIRLTQVYVDDQEKALRFYTEVLGFAKKADVTQGPYRWLTVASPEEPDGAELQLALNDNPAAKAYQEAKISPVLLLEVSSEAVATRLCSLRKLQEYEIRQVAPCILLISNEINLQTLKNLLEKEGVKTQLKGNFPTAQPSSRSYRDYDYYDY